MGRAKDGDDRHVKGGGDVPGLNSCIKAITLGAAREGWEVVGFRRGWAGPLEIDPGNLGEYEAQLMALMCVAEGASMITENIFEDRFGHAAELRRMGANIKVHGASAIVRGTPRLSGAPVMASDLRASFGLIVAGLAASGETTVNRVYHLDRGYEAAELKLAAVGADIERVAG